MFATNSAIDDATVFDADEALKEKDEPTRYPRIIDKRVILWGRSTERVS